MWGKIITIGEVEWHDLKKQFTHPPQGECEHKRLQYIEHGELIKCLDCDKQVSAVWALRMYFTHHQAVEERIEAERKKLSDDLAKSVVHRAALAVQDAWRRLKFVPTCPHCRKPILAPDGFGKSCTRNNDSAKPLILRPNLEIVDSSNSAMAKE